MLVEHRAQVTFLHQADPLVDQLPLVKQFHGRQALDAEVCGQLLFLFGVDLGNDEFAAVFVGEFFQNRRQLQAGLAPVGPEVHQHRRLHRSFQHDLLEILHADVVNMG